MPRKSKWWRFVWVPALLVGCEPTFVKTTLEGLPACPSGALETELVLKVDGPRVSSYQRLRGSEGPIQLQLVEGKQYEVKAYRCATEPCESAANLFHTATLTAPKSGASDKVSLTLPGAPACRAPPAAAPAAPEPDAGG